MNHRGFTLLEVMLSVAILTLITGLSLPVYETFMRRNDLDLTAQQLAASLRRAGTYARGVNRDSAWSVEVQPTVVTLFQGTNFATRNQAFDEKFAMPASVAISGLNEVQFAKLSAAPNTTGSITLTSSTNATRTITINAKGMVEH